MKRIASTLLVVALLTLATGVKCRAAGDTVTFAAGEFRGDALPGQSNAILVGASGSAFFYPDSISGQLEFRFSRDAGGRIVDGPVDLVSMTLVLPAVGFGEIAISLDAEVAGVLDQGDMGFTSLPFTLTATSSCLGYCEPLDVPSQQLVSASGLGTAPSLQLSLVGSRLSTESAGLHELAVNVDLGLGPVAITLRNVNFTAIEETLVGASIP